MSAPRFSAVILAAGRSTRTGTTNKLLLPFKEDTILGTVIRAVEASGVGEIIIVTGYQAHRIKHVASSALKASGKPWKVVHAPHFMRGLSESLKAGIEAVHPKSKGAIVCLGDMPLITHQVIDSLLDEYRAGDLAAVPTREGKWGNPVLLSRALFPKVRALTGDKGAKPILKRLKGRLLFVPVDEEGVEIDIDTPEDWEGIREQP